MSDIFNIILNFEIKSGQLSTKHLDAKNNWED